ncbi:MAG: DUF1684 domain-containing protein [Anaerolineales bacterium]|nr:DUF1684 domain-containing protein [Anaerolineales bacterium]
MNADLMDFRAQVDDFLQFHPQSPLDVYQRDDFTGLAYYAENVELIFEVKVQRLPDTEPLVTMETSTGDRRLYRRWGQFDFTAAAAEARLTIYSDPYAEDFFLPFRDATNGKETYGAGRYMDNHRPGLTPLGGNRFLVDFNYCYNPYCAYNAGYSCPLPPRENWLTVPIRAGEKKFA